MNPEMPPSKRPDQPAEQKTYDFETTKVGGKIYNVELLEALAEKVEAEPVPLEELREAVAEGHYYWIDRDGEKLGPHQLLQDWEAAQKNPAWADHVETVRRADLTNPIWVTENEFVFNGMHRLTRAFLDGAETIMARRFRELPKEAVVE